MVCFLCGTPMLGSYCQECDETMSSKGVTIYTHSGMFHADDAMACAIVLSIYPLATIKRVNSLPQDFNAGFDIAVDIGGKYDPDGFVFDHHQRGGSDDHLAATGKVWHRWGSAICTWQEVADRVYDVLLGSIDRADIGLRDFIEADGYSHCSVSSFISAMNRSGEHNDFAFSQAVTACSMALYGARENAAKWAKVKSEIAYIQNPGKVVELPEPGAWQEHVLADERFAETLYVIYPSDRGGFCVQCVPDAPNSFGKRKALPKEWSGLRGEDLHSALGKAVEIVLPSRLVHLRSKDPG
jgi:uncharacterized UPF0160 family protein